MAGEYATSSVTFGDLPCFVPLMLYKEAERLDLPVGTWWGKANSFRCVRGREPGRGWLLMLRRDLTDDAIQTLQSSPQQLVFTHGDSSVTLKGLYFVQATAIFADDATETSDNTMFLVELADPRIHLRSSIFDGEVSDGGDAFDTWIDLIQFLWGKLPTTAGSAPSLPDGVTITATPEVFTLAGSNVWDTICGLLTPLGLDVFYNPITTAFELIDMASEQDISNLSEDENLPRLDASTNHKEGAANFPEKIRVYFPKGKLWFTSGQDQILVSAPWGGGDYYKDIATVLTGAASGSLTVLCYPIGANSSLSHNDLDDIADEVAGNYTSRLMYAVNCGFRRYRAPLYPPYCGSQIAEVRFFDYGWGMFTEFYGQQTTEREYRGPIKFLPVPAGSIIAWATTTAAVAKTDATFDVKLVVPFDGSTWIGDGAGGNEPYLTVSNDPDVGTADSGARGKIISTVEDGVVVWHYLDFPCPT
jgi:hypothetical protein